MPTLTTFRYFLYEKRRDIFSPSPPDPYFLMIIGSAIGLQGSLFKNKFKKNHFRNPNILIPRISIVSLKTF